MSLIQDIQNDLDAAGLLVGALEIKKQAEKIIQTHGWLVLIAGLAFIAVGIADPDERMK